MRRFDSDPRLRISDKKEQKIGPIFFGEAAGLTVLAAGFAGAAGSVVFEHFTSIDSSDNSAAFGAVIFFGAAKYFYEVAVNEISIRRSSGR